MCEGKPFIKPKNQLGKDNVGIDLGPSTIAIVSDREASLLSFASSLILMQRVSVVFNGRWIDPDVQPTPITITKMEQLRKVKESGIVELSRI